MRATIAVLMATYNGEAWLEDQLDSLWRQTRQDFELLVRDDGSTDATLQILERTARQRPGRIRIIQGEARLGPKDSFAELLRLADAPYVAFCDQDDYWMPQRLELTVGAIARAEAMAGGELPILACSDATVTDEALRPMGPTYFRRHRFRPIDGPDRRLSRLLFRNYAIGTTSACNAALVRLARAMPEEAVMHDWWCALIASALGRSIVLPQPLVLYRQHGRNTIGSPQWPFPRSWAEVQAYLQRSREGTARCLQQARALLRVCGPFMPEAERAMLAQCVAIPTQPAWARIRTVLQARAFKPGLLLTGLHLYGCVAAKP